MKVFGDGRLGKTNTGRFSWLRETNTKDTDEDHPGSWEFLRAYADFDGDIYSSMQAAIDTDTPYVQDLLLRFTTAILEGKIK
jgi:hypothetical protein